MEPEMAGTVLTLCVFGGLGWFLAWALSMPVRVHIWILLILAVVGGAFVGINTSLFSVFGVAIRLNAAVVSCAAGMLIGRLVRTRRQHRLHAGRGVNARNDLAEQKPEPPNRRLHPTAAAGR